MKKYLTIFIFLVVLVTLSSCAGNDHTHEYGTDYKFNNTHHWNECVVEGCTEKSNQAEHEMEGNKCSICGYVNEEISTAPEHTHEYDDAYVFNETSHWHACKVEGCFEKDSLSEHQFGNPEITYTDKLMTIVNKCVDCGYETKEEIEIDSNIDSAIEWNEMFEAFELTNYSLNICFEKDENGEWITTNHCEVDANGAHMNMRGNLAYTKTTDGQTYVTYSKALLEDNFVKYKDQSKQYYDYIVEETVLEISFLDNYEKFTYNEEKGIYECKEVIVAKAHYYEKDKEPDDIYCRYSAVVVVNGKISSIYAEYSFESLDSSISYFEYYNIGSTVVSIPEYVVETAIPEE